MDYRSMKRKELQALCKEHNIPANSANSVLADKLSELLNEKQKPTSRQRACLKSAVETTDESEPAVSRRQAKKVRFSPNNELVEYELRSGKKEKDMVIETKSRRKSVVKKVAKPVVDDINTVELTDDNVQIPVRLTRSRVQEKDDINTVPINEKKQGRRAVKDVRKETKAVKELEGNLGKVTRSKVHTLGKDGDVQLDENKQNKRAVKDVEKGGESVEETVVGRGRVTRSKAQTLMEDDIGVNLNPKVKKKSGRGVVNDVDKVEPSKEIMGIPVRVTRSRGQTLTDDVAKMVAVTQAEKKTTRREAKVSDLSNVASENKQELPRRISLRTRGVEIASEDVNEKSGHGKRKKRSEESQHHADMESRQSRRNKAKVEDSTVLNPSVKKVEMVVERKVTRSKAALAMKSSEGNNKRRAKNKVEVQRESKMVPQLEEPLEHAGRKDVNRRKSVMQKVKGKGIDKSLVEKKEVVKEIEMVESPNTGTRKTVGKRKSKEQSGDLSILDEGLEDEKNVTRSGKDATENEIKSVASVTRSQKSKKQKGNPVIENQTSETVYVSPVDESPRRATRSGSKSEGKAVPRIISGAIIKDNSSKRRAKLTESKLNDSDKLAEKANTEGTPVSKSENLELDESALRLDHQGIVESAILEGHQSASPTNISGAVIKDKSSKRRAKLTESKPNDSDEFAEKSNTEGAPVSKSENLELNEKVTEIGLTPAIEESSRRLTRSAIRSERNAAVNTTPGRITRSGIKHRQNAQMFSPEVIKNSNLKKKKSPLTVQKTVHSDTMAVPSEISKEANDQILEHSVDLSVSESVRLPTEVAEEGSASMREDAIVMENVSSVSAEDASGRTIGEVMEVTGADIEKSPVQFTFSAAENETSATPHLTENLLNGKERTSVDLPKFEDETGSESTAEVKKTPFSAAEVKKTPFSTAEVAETMADIQDQNQEVYVKSATFSEAQVQIAVDLEKSIVKEMESTTKRLQTDVTVEEPVVSIPNVDISSGVIIKGNNGDADDNSDSISLEQSYDKGKSKEMEASLEPSVIEDADQFIADDGSNDQIEKESEQASLIFNDPIQNLSADKQEVADNDAHNDDDDESVSKEEYDAEANGDDPLNQSAGEDVLQGIAMEENDIKDDMVVTQDSLAEQNELSIGKNTNFIDDEVDDMKEVKSDEMPSIDNDLSSQIPILNKSDEEDGIVNVIKECETDLMPLTAGNVLQDTNGEGLNANKEHEDESNSKLLNDDDDDFNMTREVEPISEPSTTNGIDGECDNASKSHLNPSAGDDLVSKDDVEVDGINVLNEVEPGSEPSNALKSHLNLSTGDDLVSKDDEEDDGIYVLNDLEHGSEPSNALKSHLNPSTGDDLVSKDDVEDDSLNVHNKVELGSEPSNIRKFLEVSVSGNGVDSECVVDEKTDGLNGESEQEPLTSNDGINVLNDLELGSEPSNVRNILEVSFSGDVVDSECAVDEKTDGLNGESEQEPLTSNDNPMMAESEVVAQNENMPMELEVLIESSDKESEPVLNVANDEVLIGSSDKESEPVLNVDLFGSVGRSDPPKLATNENGITDKDDISKTLGDIDGVENATGIIDSKNDTSFCGSEQKSKEDCSNHGVDEENIGTPEKPTIGETSPIVNTQEKPTIDDPNSDRFTEDIGVHENPITEESLPITDKKEESPVNDTFSDPPTFFKDDDINKQEETQPATTSVDLGNHIFGLDEYREPDSANKCDDLPAEIMKDDRVSELQASARGSCSFTEKGFSPAAELANSVTDLEKASTSLADGKFSQDVFMMKSNVNADVSEDYFNWSDSSLKDLFKTPTTNRSSDLKHNEEDAVGFPFSDDRSCDDIEITGNRAQNNFDHQWESEAFDDKTQDTATQSPENEINFDEFSHNYFCDGSSDKEKEKKDKPS